jgi:excisionase family DNA binding protein
MSQRKLGNKVEALRGGNGAERAVPVNHQTEGDECEFYTLDLLAKRWQTSYRNLHRKVQEGKLRAIRLGALVRVSRKEVERVERHGI